MNCAQCGQPFTRPDARPGRPGRRAIYCGSECRREVERARERARDRTRGPYGAKSGACAVCRKSVWRGTTSLPEGQAICRPCRASAPRAEVRCCGCGTHVTPKSYWCYPCSVANRIPGKGRDVAKRMEHNRRRNARRRSAPGLSIREIEALRLEWIRQGRECSYCPELATSVDHVIPLAKGGTNHERNLAPACLPCNGSKNDLTVEEWMHRPRTRSGR